MHQVLQYRVACAGLGKVRHVSVSQRLDRVPALQVDSEPIAEPLDRHAARVLGCARVHRCLRIESDDQTPPTYRGGAV